MAGVGLVLVVAFLATEGNLGLSNKELKHARARIEDLSRRVGVLKSRTRLIDKSAIDFERLRNVLERRVHDLGEDLASTRARIAQLEADLQKAGGHEDRLGVQRSLVGLLKQELADVGVTVEADESAGTLIVPDQLLFERQSAALPQFGSRRQKMLEIGRAIIRLLENPESASKIARIEVSGHTDKTGSLDLNLMLSRNRAAVLVDGWHSNSDTNDPCVVGKLLPIGMGPNRPLIRDESAATNQACGDEPDREDTRQDESRGCARNRRIEITVVPKDPARPEIPGCP